MTHPKPESSSSQEYAELLDSQEKTAAMMRNMGERATQDIDGVMAVTRTTRECNDLTKEARARDTARIELFLHALSKAPADASYEVSAVSVQDAKILQAVMWGMGHYPLKEPINTGWRLGPTFVIGQQSLKQQSNGNDCVTSLLLYSPSRAGKQFHIANTSQALLQRMDKLAIAQLAEPVSLQNIDNFLDANGDSYMAKFEQEQNPAHWMAYRAAGRGYMKSYQAHPIRIPRSDTRQEKFWQKTDADLLKNGLPIEPADPVEIPDLRESIETYNMDVICHNIAATLNLTDIYDSTFGTLETVQLPQRH